MSDAENNGPSPSLIEPYLAPISDIRGIGPKTLNTVTELVGGSRVIDLISHLPSRWIVRSPVPDFSYLVPGEIGTAIGEVQAHVSPGSPSGPYRVRMQDDSGFLTVVYFRANQRYLKDLYPIGDQVLVSGKVEEFNGARQILHPDYVLDAADATKLPTVEPVYALTAGMTNRKLHGHIRAALESCPDLPEWQDRHLHETRAWPTFRQAFVDLHLANTIDEERFRRARERLAYDEALARETVFAASRNAARSAKGFQFDSKRHGIDRVVSRLSFAPTNAQLRAVSDIVEDCSTGHPMRRMIQGDVGAGKTLVAALAAVHAIDNEFQSAVMAPTEVLAQQLYDTINSILRNDGVSASLLTGKLTVAERSTVLGSIADGTTHVAVGTQALFQESVSFKSLGLVIVDEQHRFGVLDRARLSAKGIAPHLLIMSATPIPRSLAMTVNGDLEVSILDEKPPGRKPVDTRVVPSTRLDDILAGVKRAIKRGEKVFWVCPRVDSEGDDSAAVARHALLTDWLGVPVSLVHGRLKADDKQASLEAFRSGLSRALVATTVIEVGVDVPDATIMVIEHAQQFGLAQLHQLRGRVGRSEKASTCMLIYEPPLTDSAKTRLEVLRSTEDGFEIAEADFKLRGPGDVLGVRQSGLPKMRFLDLARDASLLAVARKDAENTVRLDPTSETERRDALLLLRRMLGPKPSAKLPATQGN